jgi:hypothetical protein
VRFFAFPFGDECFVRLANDPFDWSPAFFVAVAKNLFKRTRGNIESVFVSGTASVMQDLRAKNGLVAARHLRGESV